jgi:hypothetical protein
MCWVVRQRCTPKGLWQRHFPLGAVDAGDYAHGPSHREVKKPTFSDEQHSGRQYPGRFARLRANWNFIIEVDDPIRSFVNPDRFVRDTDALLDHFDYRKTIRSESVVVP